MGRPTVGASAFLLAMLLVACDEPAPPPVASAGSAPPAASLSAATSATSSASGPILPSPGDAAGFARAFVSDLGAGKWDEAARRVVPKGDKRLEGAAIKSMWESSAGSRGAFVEILSTTSEARGDRSVLRVKAKLEQGTMDVQLAVDDKGIGRFRIIPAKAPYESPKYVDPSKFEARDVMVGEGNGALPGVLTIPKGVTNPPTIILVHGSGGGDRDESNDAGCRPFRDLAEGLASRGVAVLRWDKRSGDPYGGEALKIPTADFTIEHEYLTDVASAIALVRKTPGLDPDAVFIVGHSQGAWLTPWLLKLHPEIAGGVLLAGNSRAFHEVVVPQLEYIARLDDGKIGFLEKSAIEDRKKQWARAADPKLPLDTAASDLPFNTGPKYWLSIVAYDAVKTANEIKMPLLILQGGRDYQVTEKEDFAGWKRGLAARKGTDFKLYANLNHAFVAGEGMATPKEYETSAGHVDERVLDDVMSWLPKK